MSWRKPLKRTRESGSRAKFIIGGVLILAAIIYLIISSTKANAEYFFTIDELISRGQSMVGQNVRISGAVVRAIQSSMIQLISHYTSRLPTSLQTTTDRSPRWSRSCLTCCGH